MAKYYGLEVTEFVIIGAASAGIRYMIQTVVNVPVELGLVLRAIRLNALLVHKICW